MEAERCPIIFDLDIDFDKLNEDEFEHINNKAHTIADKVAKNQINTQNKVIYISPNNGIKLESIVEDISSIMGQKCKINSNVTLLGTCYASYVFSEIKAVRPIIISIEHNVSHITITNCSNIIIKSKKPAVAGIECINSMKINICVKKITFLRITTGSDINVHGLYDNSTILDIRNSTNIYVNNDNIPICMFNEARFSYNPSLYIMKDEEDIFSSGNLSLPNISLLKYHR